MPDAVILEVLGVEVEIRAWRGTDNTFEATLQYADGRPIPLDNTDVSFIVVDRAGGTVMLTQVNTPGDHVSPPSGGVTRFTLGADVFAALTGQRAYTWKYQIVSRELTTGQKHIHFWGDLRILPPFAPI